MYILLAGQVNLTSKFLKNEKGESSYNLELIVLCFRSCSSGCLNSTLVKGKIVVCDRTSGYGEAQRAGAVGSILLSNTIDNIPLVYSFPSTALSSNDYDSVQTYLSSTKYGSLYIYSC